MKRKFNVGDKVKTSKKCPSYKKFSGNKMVIFANPSTWYWTKNDLSGHVAYYLTDESNAVGYRSTDLILVKRKKYKSY